MELDRRLFKCKDERLYMTVTKPCGPWPGISRRPLDERLLDVVNSDFEEMTSLQEKSMPLKRPCAQDSPGLFKWVKKCFIIELPVAQPNNKMSFLRWKKIKNDGWTTQKKLPVPCNTAAYLAFRGGWGGEGGWVISREKKISWNISMGAQENSGSASGTTTSNCCCWYIQNKQKKGKQRDT